MIADVTTDLTSWWAPGLAFVAGLVSFASPCVFPLVPGYLSFVAGGRAVGVAAADGSAAVLGVDQPDASGGVALAPILLFIAGFSVVFVLLGAFASTFAQIFRGDVARWLGGGFVIAMGLLMLGYAWRRGPIGLYAERRPLLERARPGLWGAFPLGVAFGAGWTPCIGPVLAGILVIAAGQSAARGVLLLAAYSAGLGVPFLLVGLGVQRLVSTLDWVKRNYRWFAGVSGALMVVLGWLIATGALTRLLAPLTRYAPFGI
jgi:cytochrome c-type biogenesis protein